MKKTIIISILLIIGITVLDYINLPTLLGMNISNMNWDFYMGILNIISVLLVFIVTFKTLNKKEIVREKNKKDISILLLEECYKECQNYIDFLNDETVKKYVVPKIDFDSTDHKIIKNLRTAPFENENIIMDLVKDGQIPKQQIEGYFNIKRKFGQYVNMRILIFDGPHVYEPLKTELSKLLKDEIISVHNLSLNNQ
ncbi:TPA: hypothetical protein ACSVPQ_001588 [Clostridioides difficile]|uniref:hypothetical protein n=1 Tax=Clostridioides difficile TaxID=1496 RepID=UPI0003B2A4A7|nr:hypothetical protein [Clostridioides difficile]EGT5399581.1 hypothetical protein [Clostridioides difficile]EII6781667.1 hypothetical protein [Clostridioides difficile]EKS6795677.1 hypothetical protein [Clostridioides difficile]ELX4546617.1 hypothetical protein [Clostridioides difficile]MBF9986718.1 hypothetical protein [Clostridioides difficile]